MVYSAHSHSHDFVYEFRKVILRVLIIYMVFFLVCKYIYYILICEYVCDVCVLSVSALIFFLVKSAVVGVLSVRCHALNVILIIEFMCLDIFFSVKFYLHSLTRFLVHCFSISVSICLDIVDIDIGQKPLALVQSMTPIYHFKSHMTTK